MCILHSHRCLAQRILKTPGEKDAKADDDGLSGTGESLESPISSGMLLGQGRGSLVVSGDSLSCSRSPRRSPRSFCKA